MTVVETPLTPEEEAVFDSIVESAKKHSPQLRLFQAQLLAALQQSEALTRRIHSIRSRLKDLVHLRAKLGRKLKRAKAGGPPFDVTPDNVLVKINDLIGVRILHLHTTQMREIDRIIRDIVQENTYELVEGPFARTWDDESRSFFRDCGITTQASASMYTSVHYVLGSASRTKVTAELQVRTLSEEVWGEVDHSMNYPDPTQSLACREQLKVLARVTSSATRLVDSIFATMADHLDRPEVDGKDKPEP